MRRRIRYLFVMALVATSLVTTAPVAGAATPSCGDTVVGLVVFTSDLTCGPGIGDALTVGADGTVIDLNGFTLRGSNDFSGIGIGTHANVTIRNGTIRNFDTGIVLNFTRNATVSNVRLVRNEFWGLNAFQAFGLRVENSVVRRNGSSGSGAGMLINESLSVQVDGNRLIANTGPGLEFQDAEEYSVTGNLVRANTTGAKVDGSVDLSWRGNRFIENSEFGIIMDGARGQIVDGNRFRANAIGILVADPVFGGGNSTQNVFSDNRFVGNFKAGIHLEDPRGEDVTVTGNVARDGNVFGFRLDAGSATFTNNRAVRHLQTGFRFLSGKAELGGNVSNNNAFWGFFADATATLIDLGGNSAAGNGIGDCNGGLSC